MSPLVLFNMAFFERVPPGTFPSWPQKTSKLGDAVQTNDFLPPVIVDIINLVDRNSEKLEFFDELDGGWEGWLQPELAYYLSPQTPANAFTPTYGYTSVQREVRTFINPSDRINIFCRSRQEYFNEGGECIASHDSDQAHPRIGIELKAGTGYKDHSTGTKYSLTKRIMEDIEKIQNMHPDWTGSCGARVFAVGISKEQEYQGYEKTMNQLLPPFEPVRYTMTRNGFCVIWWFKDFPKLESFR